LPTSDALRAAAGSDAQNPTSDARREADLPDEREVHRPGRPDVPAAALLRALPGGEVRRAAFRRADAPSTGPVLWAVGW
jgi:hypothetical protein